MKARLGMLVASASLIALFLMPLWWRPEEPRLQALRMLPWAAELSVSSLVNCSSLAYDAFWADVDAARALSSARAAERALEVLAEASRLRLEGELGARVKGAARAYLSVGWAAGNASSAAVLLDAARPKLRAALSLLLAGEVDEAIAAWLEARNAIRGARRHIAIAIAELTSASSSSMLSPEHSKAVEEALERLRRLHSEIDQVEELFKVVEENREAVKSLCSGCCSTLDTSTLDVGRAGRYAYYVEWLKQLPAAGAGWASRGDD